MMSVSARAEDVRYGACLCVFLCGLLYGGTAGMSGKNGSRVWKGTERAHTPGYEVTYPQWLPLTSHRFQDGQQMAPKYPSDVGVWITAEGRDLLLQLQKNKNLFSPAFREIWYSPEGTRHTVGPNHQDHCFYHGSVVGWGDSSLALSTCFGLRGVVSLNYRVSYIIEPLANQTEPWGHAVLRAERLKLAARSDHGRYGDQLRELIGGMAYPHPSGRFMKRGQDREKVKMTLMEAANYVDKYYKAVGVRVAVTGLEVWNAGDQIDVSENPFTTLSSFLTWRRKQLPQLPNDNAQLITGKSFQGTTIGLAPVKSMCSEYQSGGVNSDHSTSVFGVAATLAHELGHNFGMSHDSPGCCQANPDQGGCIMASATGAPFPRVFNVCNQRELQRFLSSGGGRCVFNPPDPSARLGGAQCGNGYLEEGEECDCGEEEECVSPCCHAANCTLKAGAQCAHGICCHNCKLRRPGEVCRPAVGSCDLPEFCDGMSEACPDNFFLLDGSMCEGGGAYCYTGMCLTLKQQCVSLWGSGADVAPEVCFTEVNRAGDQFGNCGKDMQENYRSCSHRDAMCGKIQCVSEAESPVGMNAVVISTTVRSGRTAILCKGTHVHQPADTLDPGLVMTGTRCGESGMCFSGECRNASFLQADQCIAKCHGHGVCNNRHHCHCDSGWAPPFCYAPGDGGSVDSGPVTPRGTLLPVVLLLLFLIALLGLATGGFWCCCKHKLRLLKSLSPAAAQTNPGSLSDSKGEAGGHANPTFQLRNPEPQNTPTASPRSSHASCSRNAVVRPTTKPPPIPAYALNTDTTNNTHIARNTHSTNNTHTAGNTHTTNNTHTAGNTYSIHTSHTGPHTQPNLLSHKHTPQDIHPTQMPSVSHIPKTHSPSHTQSTLLARRVPPSRPPPICPGRTNQQTEQSGLQVKSNPRQSQRYTLAPPSGPPPSLPSSGQSQAVQSRDTTSSRIQQDATEQS